MKIGFDMDGVLSDFNEAFVQRAIEVTKKNLFPKEWGDPTKIAPPVWEYAQYFGYSPEENSAIWESIKTDDQFWVTLKPTAEMALVTKYYNNSDDDVYFITNRQGICVKVATEVWLENRGIEYATVLISNKKGHIACGLELDCYIDDCWDNIYSIQSLYPKTRAYLLDKPYNRQPVTRRVRSVEEFLREEKLI